MNTEELFFIFCKVLEKATREAAAAAAERREQIRDEYAAACRHVDEDPRERQRIHDIVDLIEAEDALYDQAIAALDRGDHDQALPLLRRTAQAGIGEAAWMLAGLLEERGDTAEAITWYQQAADDGDPRADDKLAGLYSRRTGRRIFISYSQASGDTSEVRSAIVERPSIFVVDSSEAFGTWDRSLALPSDADFLYFPAGLGTPPADPYRYLKTPHHGATLWSESLPWATVNPILYVEGATDAAVFRHLQDQGSWVSPMAVEWAMPANSDAGVDLIVTLDNQMLSAQVKTAKWLRHQVALRSRLWDRMVAASAVTWCAEHHAAAEPTAGEAMTPLALLTILAADTPVHEATEQMLQAGAQALLVGDPDQVMGVVTLADLARRIHDSRGVLSIERVQALMRPAAAVEMAAPLSTARALMARGDIGLVAVTGPGGMTVGCITAQSLLADETGSADTARPEPPGTRIPLLRPGNDLVKICLPI